MLNAKKQINKMGAKKQVKKAPVKKVINNWLVWTCLTCNKSTISIDKPITCPCSIPVYVVNTKYEVKQ